MKNLMTRKIILGMLITLALVFSVQGIAEAISGLTPSTAIASGGVGTATGDLGSLSIGGTITVTISGGTLDLDNVRESITVSVSGSGVGTGATSTNFVNPAGNRATSYVWRETDNDTTDGTNHNAASTFATDETPGTVTITVRRAGEITVTVSHIETYDTTRSRTARVVNTYYIVKQAYEVSPNDTVSLLGVSRGVGAGYGETDNFRIHSADGRNNRVTYNLVGTDGELYIREGSRYRNADDTGYLLSSTTTLTTSSSAEVWLDMGSTSQTVTATVVTTGRRTEGIYILRVPKLAVGTQNQILNVDTDPTPLTGNPEQVIDEGAINVQVMQSTLSGQTVVFTTPVSNVPVKFDVVDKSVAGGYLIPPVSTGNSGGYSGNIVDANNNPMRVTDIPNAARTLYVRASDSNTASVGFEFGTAEGTSEITVSVAGTRVTISKTVDVIIGDETNTQLSISSNTKDSGNANIFHLVARVADKDGNSIWGKTVTFRTRFGNLENTPTGETGITNPDGGAAVDDDAAIQEGLTVTDITTRSGLARVSYDLGSNRGRQEIHASIDDMTNARQEITFVVNGPAVPTTPTSPTPPTTRTPTLTITTTGEGATRSVTVTATDAQGANPPISVLLSGTALTTSRLVTAGTAETITLPTAPGDYTLLATAPGYTEGRITLTVAAPPQPGTLTINRVGDRVGGQQALRVTAATADGSVPSSAVRVTLSGVTLPQSLTIPAGDGSISFTATLPSTSEAHVVTATATGYNDDSVIVPAPTSGQQTRDTTQPTTTGPVGVADSIEIDGDRQLSGTLAQAMRFRARVLDANNNGVSGVAVTFRVLTPGRGTFAGARGSGRAIRIDTDRTGYVSTNFTPTHATSTGTITVEAKAAGVTAPVTFIITVGEASETETETETRDTSTPPSREISPVVHVGAANRPPMLWVDGGKIYALVGADVQEFGSGVENAMNIAIGGGKVYWTEMTGESSGTINSANLDGTGATELKSILAVPMGIAVDTTNSKLYWTNSRGRIQSLNADGSGRVENVLQNLPSPMDIAVERGNLYWTQYDATASAGNVGIVNPNAAQKIARYISTGADSPGSLTINGGKVYWTEMTGTNSGTINSANLNGNGATQLASILAAPSGIAVDGSRSKLYWTNSRGRIQSANLNGKKIQNVVDGLGNPGDMVLSNSIAAPVAPTTPTTPTTTDADYDVDGSGSVDNVDVFLVALAVGTSNAKYDVNGDGTVDDKDIALVRDNRDSGAAAAPMIVGMKLSADQIGRLQEQIDLLVASSDRSPATLKTLIYLQQLLATGTRPEKTQLLANYPNPFNPETWIPYELATDTNVRITIYNTQGVVIRTLELGHQSAGYYTGRDSAAYWDGRNTFGEQVASGIYFYHFETNDMSSMRKMVILK